MPAPPPAIRFVAAEAGFFWPSPLTLFADIAGEWGGRGQAERVIDGLRFSDWVLEGVERSYSLSGQFLAVIMAVFLVRWKIFEQ